VKGKRFDGEMWRGEERRGGKSINGGKKERKG
jgi:hypothetical protein